MHRKKWFTWLIAREDIVLKVLVATSGLVIGLMVGKGLQVFFA